MNQRKQKKVYGMRHETLEIYTSTFIGSLDEAIKYARNYWGIGSIEEYRSGKQVWRK